MYEDVLVPTDGGELTPAAARRAFDLATRYDATVHGLYVVETDTSWLAVSKDEVRDTLREVGADAADRALAALEATASDHDVELRTVVREGRPATEILEYVEAADIDLVVMGTHGHAGVRQRLLGSVTERVVRNAPVPVMTVGPEA